VPTNYTCKYVLGEDREVYENLIEALPAGMSNLTKGIVVPAHPEDQPPTFEFGNLTAGERYRVDLQGEWATAPIPRRFFTASGVTHTLSIPLPYGPVTVTLFDKDDIYVRYLLSVVNYATFFRAYSREITEYSEQPLRDLKEAISNDLAYRLATPMLAGLTTYIPADLEILSSLAHKLLIKNFLHVPGTLGATTEILAAFSASNPAFFKMSNLSLLDSPLYRSEEVFQGYEGHVWLPNSEIERWRAFILLINNLPQLYSIKQITEQEVHIDYGGKKSRHVFDFNSPLANSITSGLTYLTDCFLRLFSLTVTVEAQHYLEFCQASYILDQYMSTSLVNTDADPISVEPFQQFSLSGRFEQQYDISDTHRWIYDTPLYGDVDGVNRFFSMSGTPSVTSAIKVFVDGLLKGLYRDYRINIDSDYVAGAYPLRYISDPILIPIDISEPRPFKAPIFPTISVIGNANLQLVITPVEQGLDTISFVISHPPATILGDPEEVALQYYTPLVPSTGTVGDDQFGLIDLPVGVSSYDLVYPNVTTTSDYQLLISISVDPMPVTASEVSQISHMVVNRTTAGSTIQFSAPIEPDMKLNWMVVEDNTTSAIERGTQLIAAGQDSAQILFSGGPYVDIPVVIIQLWNTDPTPPNDVPIYLSSCMKVGPGGVIVRFSGPLVLSSYRLDYCVFTPGGAGDYIEFFTPPIGLIEAHYDTEWPYWANVELTPAPDGIRRDFTLPYPCPDPSSLYLALNGRLMTQGADRQYITDGNTVTFTFPPTSTQVIWASYPRSETGETTLPSTWDQDYLNRLPLLGGEYATGKIQTASAVAVGDTLSIGNLTFDAVGTASGLISHGSVISVGISILWTKLGVRLTSISEEPEDVAAKGTITVEDFTLLSGETVTVGTTVITEGIEWSAVTGNEYTAQSIADAILSISGVTATAIADQVVITAEIAGSFGNAIALTSSTPELTIPNPTLTGGVDAENRFRVGMSKDEDSLSLLDAINNHSVLSVHYVALLVSSGIIVQRAKVLGDGLYNEPMVVFGSSLSATNIIGDGTPSNYHECTVYNNEHVIGLPYSDVSIGTDRILNNSDMLYDGLAVNITPVYTTLNVLDYTLVLGATISLGTTVLTEGVEWTASTSNDVTASSISDAIVTAALGLAATTEASLVKMVAEVSIAPLTVSVSTPQLSLYNPYISILPDPLDVMTTYYVVNRTDLSFQLATTQGGVPITLIALGTGYYRITSQDVEVPTFTFHNQTASVEVLGTLFSGSSVVSVPSTEALSIGMAVQGIGIEPSSVIRSIDHALQITLSLPATLTSIDTLECRRMFQENEPIFIDSDELPAGLIEGQKYFAVNVKTNSFQVSELPEGTPFEFTTVGGELKFYSAPQFPAGNTQELDLLALNREINRHPITSSILRTELDDDTIIVTAKEVGTAWELPLISTGEALIVSGMYSGKDPTSEIIYGTSKVSYRYDAPVVTLDGISTRDWNHFSGDNFIFDYTPTLLQEPYYVAEVFPIENHPMDSTVANLPCNYPKGCFTQGLEAHINETEVEVPYEFAGGLIISTANIPVQETPQPTLDPAVFTMSLTSCSGQASIMLWVDGIYQPPTEYSYADMGGYGEITFNVAPTPEQILWVWYIPYGSACVNERTAALVGAVDDANVTFDVVDSPWEDAPTLMVYLDGVFMLQDQDYFVSGSKTQVDFVNPPSAVPTPQTVWAHYNLGSIVPVDMWRQVHVGVTDGIQDTYLIPHMLSSELPLTADTVIVFLDGINQGGQYGMETDVLGDLTGNIIFTGGVPEANRRLDVVYIRI
jgi:hypothetical protein